MQKTAYEMRISDWSSDVCSSDLTNARQAGYPDAGFARQAAAETGAMVMETPKVWLRTRQCLEQAHSADNEVVRAAPAAGRGIRYLTPLHGCFEITARSLLQHGPITVISPPPRQAFLHHGQHQASTPP